MKPIYRKSWARNVLMWSDLTLDSSNRIVFPCTWMPVEGTDGSFL